MYIALISALITVPINVILVGIFRSVKPPPMNLEDMLANDDKDDVENADEPFEKDDVIEISAKAGSS